MKTSNFSDWFSDVIMDAAFNDNVAVITNLILMICLPLFIAMTVNEYFVFQEWATTHAGVLQKWAIRDGAWYSVLIK